MTKRATDPGRWRLLLPLALLAGLGLGLVGCTDEETVFVDRPAFDQPLDRTNNFIGYVGNLADKKPVCGNCHATFWGQWKQHGHSHAWETLQASGSAQGFCEGCHTISENGNPAEGDAGYVAVRGQVGAERYQDVQCESCHGSGFDHATDPSVESAPLCSILPDTAATTGCGECHSGTHHPFVEQWSLSAHGNTNEYPRGREGCNECHEGRTALFRKFLETGNYIEKSGAENQPIFCVVCHDAHGSDFDANLRAPVDILGSELPSTDHLCVRCHNRRGTPPSSRGPHGAQALVVLQEDIGWIPAGFRFPALGSHGSPTSNPKICVTCHVLKFELRDPATNNFLFQSVGHTFEALPCVDENGIPTGGSCELAQKTFKSCVSSGCHSSQDAVRQLYGNLQDEINGLLDQLWVDVNGDGAVDTLPVDTGLFPQVVARAYANPADTLDIYPRDGLITVGEGAFFNALIAFTDDRSYFATARLYRGLAGSNKAGITWSAHPSSANGVHNPRLIVELLKASIAAVKSTYGLP